MKFFLNYSKSRNPMKQLSLLVFLLFLVSCNQKEKTHNSIRSSNKMENSKSIYGEKLIESNFLKYADSSKIDSLEINLKNSFDIYNQDNSKITHIDAEALSGFSFDFFLPQLNKILEKRNMNLTVKTSTDYEKTNDIVINGEQLNLYTKKELDNETFWNVAPKNFFKKVNEILRTDNIDEQFYLL